LTTRDRDQIRSWRQTKGSIVNAGIIAMVDDDDHHWKWHQWP